MTLPDWAISILSGVVVALVTMGIALAIQKWKQSTRRQTYLVALRNQLQENKKTFERIENELLKSRILSYIDLSLYHNFLASEYMDIEKDKQFIGKLQNHLDNVAKYKLVLQRLNLYMADFTNVGSNKVIALEGNVKDIIPEFKTDIDSCLKELRNLIDDKSK